MMSTGLKRPLVAETASRVECPPRRLVLVRIAGHCADRRRLHRPESVVVASIATAIDDRHPDPAGRHSPRWSAHSGAGAGAGSSCTCSPACCRWWSGSSSCGAGRRPARAHAPHGELPVSRGDFQDRGGAELRFGAWGWALARPRRSWNTFEAQGRAGLMAMPSGRFFGWVIGGTLPAALAADWLVSAWDQNAGMRSRPRRPRPSRRPPATWLLDLLGLPASAAVGFVTGATMANFTGLAAGRGSRADRAGWDVDGDGCRRARGCTCSSARTARHGRPRRCATSGSGAPTWSPADEQGRHPAVERLAAALASGRRGPAIVVPAGRQPALRRLRPVRRGDRRRARARRLGARRRRLRAVGGGRRRELPHLTAGCGRPTPGPPTRTRR